MNGPELLHRADAAQRLQARGLFCVLRKGITTAGVKRYWEIIADNLSKAGWSVGYVSTVDFEGRLRCVVLTTDCCGFMTNDLACEHVAAAGGFQQRHS